ncbi:MAG: hypothetical protein ABSF95_21100 [Verrucomicrobiota bacterium]|jgi:hypothetical protein
MKWYRTLAAVWSLSAAAGLSWLIYHFSTVGRDKGDDLLFWFGAFCILPLLGSVGLFRARTWARWFYLVLSSVLLFFCLSVVIVAPHDYSRLAYLGWWVFLLFSVCSLGILLFARRYEAQT